MSAIRRIQKELHDLRNENDSQNAIFSVAPVDDNNLFVWSGYLFGPVKSPYEGGVFKIVVEFPNNYPFKPPKIYFKTKIYHANISESGAICLDILKNNWSPALNISKTLISLSSLLTDPNADDPLSPDVAHVYKANRTLYDKTAKEWTLQYAQKL
jgi:ubiquitin-conjugating enzyme E2 D